MIPKVIHYCWFGNNPLTNDVKECIKSWKKNCPDYRIKLWNETNFDVNQHPFIKSAYEAKAWAFVSDYARLKIIYDEGGIYLDTDVELLKSLDSLLNNPSYVGIQQVGNVINTGLGFGAEKENCAIKKMLDQYDALIFTKDRKDNLVCPLLNTKAVNDLGGFSTDEITVLKDIVVYPSKYFDPISPGDTQYLKCDDTFSIHHYSASWTNKNNRIKRKISRFIGEKRIYKIKRILKGTNNE